MLAKYIRCSPKQGMKNAFSTAQESWSATSQSKGFHGQFGGWDINSGEAIVLALWEDKNSIDEFMATTHDTIADNNHQTETYTQCLVDYLTIELPINDLMADYSQLINNANYIRIADCQLHDAQHPSSNSCLGTDNDCEQQFISTQKNIWNPAMVSCAGMQGGFVARFKTFPRRYLVISFWETEKAHQEYMNNAFSPAKDKAKLSNYIKVLQGQQIHINNAWTVKPNQLD